MTGNTIAGAMASRTQAQAFASPGQEFVFEPATKDKEKCRLALEGPAGSGKTWTSLAVATAFGGSVGLIDTERKSAKKYSKKKDGTGAGFTFSHLPMTRYDPRDLIGALAAAAAAGFDTVIVDSLSKFWSGAGGMLEIVNSAAKRSYGGNTWAGWGDASPIENAMVEALLSFPGHVIVTMRVKTGWVIGEDARGRSAPQRVGLKAVQRDGLDYEFDIVARLDTDNTLAVIKSRCPELSGQIIPKPGADFAQAILDWLDDGEETDTIAEIHAAATAPDVTYEGLRALYVRAKRLGVLGAAIQDPDGQTTTLGDLIEARGAQARAEGGA